MNYNNFLKNTYWSIEFSFVIHSKVKTTVHTSNTDQSHCHTDEFQDTWIYKQNNDLHLLENIRLMKIFQRAVDQIAKYNDVCGRPL